jgi:hypothetical protein
VTTTRKKANPPAKPSLPGQRTLAAEQSLLPCSADQVESLKQVLLLSREDERALQRVLDILDGKAEDYLNALLGLMAAHPDLRMLLRRAQGKPEDDREVVYRHFRQWLTDTCRCVPNPCYFSEPQAGAEPPGSLPPLRYLLALSYPLSMTARLFLAEAARDTGELEHLQQALLKALLLQTAVLSRRYVEPGVW